jgi:hypothetical protein
MNLDLFFFYKKGLHANRVPSLTSISNDSIHSSQSITSNQQEPEEKLSKIDEIYNKVI